MTHFTFDDLLKKIAEDQDFRVALVNAPEATLRGIGLSPTQAQLDAIKGVDLKSIEAVAQAFGGTGVHADTLGFC